MIVLYVIIILIICAIVLVGAISQLKEYRGWWGERLIRFILCFLPKDYNVFNDVRVCSNGRRCQIDHLVISPYGIFVIETKSYLGYTSGYGFDKMWRRKVLGKSYLTHSHMLHNQYLLDVLGQYLRLDNSFDYNWLRSVVVFGLGSKVRLIDRPFNVVMFYRLYSYIRSFKMIVIPPASIKNITLLISGLH